MSGVLSLGLLGCGASEIRSVDQTSAALSATGHGGAHDHGFPAGINPEINTLLYGVAQADFVGHVVVSRVEGRLGTTGTAGAPAIWSKVEFKVLHALKDVGVSADARFSLDFLGGRLGPKEMHVDHVPRFTEGDELILIARSHETPCPSFAGEYGVLRVDGEHVRTYFGHQLRDITENGFVVANPQASAARAPAPIPLGNASGHSVSQPFDAEANLNVTHALARLAALVGT